MPSRWRVKQALLLLCASVGGCRAQSLGPEALRVKVHVSTEEERPLRYAVLWLEAGATRIVVGQEGRVAPDGNFELQLSKPNLAFERLSPREQLHLGTQERIGPGGHVSLEDVLVPVYRPRLVVFVDDNGNERIDLSVSEGRVNDTVVAIDSDSGPSIALLEDPKAAIARLTLENTARFYELSPVFSDFVFVSGYGFLSQVSQSTLQLTSGVFLPYAPFCARQIQPVDGGAALRVHVDDALDSATLCGLEVPNCSAIDLSRPPEVLEHEGVQTQCRTNGELSALNVSRPSYECKACVCSSTPILDSFIASQDALPQWWPCGQKLPYCQEDRLALYTWDYRCGGLDADAGAAGADAGGAGVAEAGTTGLDAAASKGADTGDR
jgi:hypothetical protein